MTVKKLVEFLFKLRTVLRIKAGYFKMFFLPSVSVRVSHLKLWQSTDEPVWSRYNSCTSLVRATEKMIDYYIKTKLKVALNNV